MIEYLVLVPSKLRIGNMCDIFDFNYCVAEIVTKKSVTHMW